MRQNYRQLIPLCIAGHRNTMQWLYKNDGVPAFLSQGVSGRENAGVILNHTLIQQKMTAIVNVLRIEFNR